jgi:hypothetical protein
MRAEGNWREEREKSRAVSLLCFCGGYFVRGLFHFCHFLRSPGSYCLDLVDCKGTVRITFEYEVSEGSARYKGGVTRREESSAEKRA